MITFSARNKIKCFECNSHDDLGCLDPLFSGIDTSEFRYYCKISYYPLHTDTYYRHNCTDMNLIAFSAGNKIKCFECNSHDDSRCEDPFNWTTIPNRKLCEGCCVKIVQGINTGE